MNSKINSFQDLVVWQKSHKLALDIYEASKKFPKDEKTGLTPQIRMAISQVPAYIAEGFKRRAPKEKSRLYNNSQSSLEQARYYLILCRDLGYLKDYDALWNLSEEVSRMLSRLAQSARSQNKR